MVVKIEQGRIESCWDFKPNFGFHRWLIACISFSKQSTEELENCDGQRTLILGVTSDHLCLYHCVNIVSLQLLLLLNYDAVDRPLISLLVKYIKYLSRWLLIHSIWHFSSRFCLNKRGKHLCCIIFFFLRIAVLADCLLLTFHVSNAVSPWHAISTGCPVVADAGRALSATLSYS